MKVESLFIKNIDSLINPNWKSRPKDGFWVFHKISSDLQQDFSGWDSIIYEEVKRKK